MNLDLERQMRNVAQNLSDSYPSFSSNRPLLSHSQSINLVASQEFAVGRRRDGRMSSVRRFFCLYCLFDMLFTTLVWLICVMLTGESVWDMWKSEVLKYTFSTSLIDVAGVAMIRFLLLVLAYGAIQMNHWTIVAMTTAGTCMFLITKVFLFDWTKTAQPVFEVFLVLISFSLCWSEAWFLDCKVMPSEIQAREIMESVDQPVIGSMRGVPSDVNSIADYYSPRDSPNGSPIFGRKLISHPTVSDQNEEYVKKGVECLDNCLSLLNTAGWKEQKKGNVDGDIVESMDTDKYGKIYLMTTILECPAEFLFDEFSNKVEELHKWNPTILESVFVQKIDNFTDITYQVTAGGGGGAIKPRDFVNLRHNTLKDDRFLCSSTSIEFPGYPPNKKYIRGENRVGCWSMQPLPPKQGSNRVRCKFQWLMGCNLKGWIPQYVLDVAFSTTMLDFIDTLRNFIEKKRLEQAF